MPSKVGVQRCQRLKYYNPAEDIKQTEEKVMKEIVEILQGLKERVSIIMVHL